MGVPSEDLKYPSTLLSCAMMGYAIARQNPVPKNRPCLLLFII